MSMLRTLVIIPTYNEAENIERIVTSIQSLDAEIYVLTVDDCSPDGTGAIAEKLARRSKGRVFVLHRPQKAGLGGAYLDGFRFGLDRDFEVICQMDADGSHDPDQLLALMADVENGTDLAIGSRRVPGGKILGWGPHRHFMSRGAMLVSRLLLRLKTRDVTSGFRCYRVSVIAELLRGSIQSDGYAFQEETLMYSERLGFRVTEVPIVFRDRIYGRSKLTWRDVGEFFITMWRLRRAKPGDLQDEPRRLEVTVACWDRWKRS
jgi:dolichol-phosphate mannosyltransferase